MLGQENTSNVDCKGGFHLDEKHLFTVFDEVKEMPPSLLDWRGVFHLFTVFGQINTSKPLRLEGFPLFSLVQGGGR